MNSTPTPQPVLTVRVDQIPAMAVRPTPTAQRPTAVRPVERTPTFNSSI